MSYGTKICLTGHLQGTQYIKHMDVSTDKNMQSYVCDNYFTYSYKIFASNLAELRRLYKHQFFTYTVYGALFLYIVSVESSLFVRKRFLFVCESCFSCIGFDNSNCNGKPKLG